MPRAGERERHQRVEERQERIAAHRDEPGERPRRRPGATHRGGRARGPGRRTSQAAASSAMTKRWHVEAERRSIEDDFGEDAERETGGEDAAGKGSIHGFLRGPARGLTRRRRSTLRDEPWAAPCGGTRGAAGGVLAVPTRTDRSSGPRRSHHANLPPRSSSSRSSRSCSSPVRPLPPSWLQPRPSRSAKCRSAMAAAVPAAGSRRRAGEPPRTARRSSARPIDGGRRERRRRRRQDHPDRVDGPRSHRCRRRPSGVPGRRSSRWAGTSAPATPGRTARPPYADDHVPHPGRPLGGRARRAALPERPDLEGRVRTDPGRRGHRPDRRPRGPDPEPPGERDGAPGDRRRATKISDVLEIQAQLTNVRGQIEQLTRAAQGPQRSGRASPRSPPASACRSSPSRSRRAMGARHGRRRGVREPDLHPAGPDRRRDLVRHRVAADAARVRRIVAIGVWVGAAARAHRAPARRRRAAGGVNRSPARGTMRG